MSTHEKVLPIDGFNCYENLKSAIGMVKRGAAAPL